MGRLKTGDVVEIRINKEEFIRRARNNSSTPDYITHMAEGKIAEVIRTDNRSVQLKADELNYSSNWFEMEWFQLVDTKLRKIKQESQRL